MTRRYGQTGAALLLVVWIVALLSLLAATALQITTASGHIAQGALERAQLQVAADGAVNLAILEMVDPDPNAPWPVDGAPRAEEVGRYHIMLVTRDEAGKVDVNKAQDSLLRALAATMRSDPNVWVHAVERYRGNREGASDLQAAHATMGAGVFRTIDEVAVVTEVPQADFQCLFPDLTVYTGMENVDQRYISAGLRRALAAANNASVGSANVVLDGGSRGSYAGRVFRIEAGIKGDSSSYERSAIVRVTGDPDRLVLAAGWGSGGDSSALYKGQLGDCLPLLNSAAVQ